MADTLPPSRSLRLRQPIAAVLGLVALVTLSACQSRPSAALLDLQQRQEQLDLKLQQLEQKLIKLTPSNAADKAGKPPAGPVKSLTLRSGSEDDRLRIYWADGSTTDLPCTKEQSTLVCG
jgi:hypothetical protein